MTFATNEIGNFIYGLPGNPVSAFVCFHLFVLPTLRKFCGYSNDKLTLPIVKAEVRFPPTYSLNNNNNNTFKNKNKTMSFDVHPNITNQSYNYSF